jgi:Sec-independent protein translocase protein TatA
MNIHEILVIAMVAIIVFKPEHLPEVARFLGKTVRRCKKVFDDSSVLRFFNPQKTE